VRAGLAIARSGAAGLPASYGDRPVMADSTRTSEDRQRSRSERGSFAAPRRSAEGEPDQPNGAGGPSQHDGAGGPPGEGGTAANLYRRAVAPFVRQVQELLPGGDGELFDAHTHLGLDEDGRSLDLAGLVRAMDEAGVRRACTFPLHDPERQPAYRVPNDRVLAWAGESGGRLIPFCRLDPLDEPLTEGARCLEAGARGIKLHPRAQAFTFDGRGIRAALDGIFALAEEARVPILIHAGRGLPPIADGLVELALRHPGAPLILAHGAICDQGTLTAGLAGHPAVLYDTSCFHALDVLALLARVPAERIVFGSDPPYGRPASGLHLAIRAAHHARLDEPATRLLLGETMAALVDGRPLPEPSPPRAPATVTLSRRLARVYSYTSLAGPALFSGATDRAREGIELAVGACRDPDPGDDGETLAQLGDALAAAAALVNGEGGVPYAIDLIHRCMVLAATATLTPLPAQATPPPTRPAGAAPARAG
jgi:hypothetical protein